MKKEILKYIVVYFILILMFVGFLTVSACFPSNLMKEHVQESAKVLLAEGNRKIIYIPYRKWDMQFNNFTDALMVNTAYSIDSKTPLYSAFVARKNYIPNVTTEIYPDTAGELRSSSKYEYHNEVGELSDLANGEKAESFEYARYWHGYLILLRPLLLFFNLTQIRLILTMLLVFLAFILLWLIARKTNLTICLIFLTGLLGAEYFYLGFSLEGIFAFLIMVIASIVLLLRYHNIKNFCMFFFVVGMIVNFFDFLTVPVITLAIPLILYFLVSKADNKVDVKTILKQIIQYAFAWGMGYGLTWLTKWVLVDLFFNKHLISVAISQVLYRSASAGSIADYTLFDVLRENIIYLVTPFFISLMTTLVMVSLKMLKAPKLKIIKNYSEKLLTNILPYFIISMMPICWYMVLQNHSYYHAFFTYRSLMITNICFNIIIQAILMESLEEGKNEK